MSPSARPRGRVGSSLDQLGGEALASVHSDFCVPFLAMRPNPLWRAVAPALFRTVPLMSRPAIRATHRPFSQPSIFKPHVGGHRYGWTHYGVMIPDLHEPHRYFSTM